MDEEIWIPLKGYSFQYELCSLGDVRMLDRPAAPGSILRKDRKNVIPGKVLRKYTRKEYYVVVLRKNNKSYTPNIHRLVALFFVPNPLNYPCVNHINGIKTDNRASNLEWCTVQQNTIHAHKLGLIKNNRFMLNRKFNETDLVKIFELSRSGVPGRHIAKMYSVCNTHIYSILNGQNYRAMCEKLNLLKPAI